MIFLKSISYIAFNPDIKEVIMAKKIRRKEIENLISGEKRMKM